MKRIALLVLTGSLSMAAAAAAPENVPPLTAEQIIEHNIEARGGQDAWHRIQTMVWVGHIETGPKPATAMRYILEMKRPGKARFEIQAPGRIGVRIFDGKEGWKLRPGADGNPDLQPYSAEEVKFARDDTAIGGLLLDYKDKGVKIALEGTDEIEGHPAYRLALSLPSGALHHVWIDSQSFRELREEREVRNALGMAGRVLVSYRDYRGVQGVQIPFLIETGTGSGRDTDRMTIDRVVLNPPLDDAQFAKPLVPHRHLIAIGAHASPVDSPAWRGATLRGRRDVANP